MSVLTTMQFPLPLCLSHTQRQRQRQRSGRVVGSDLGSAGRLPASFVRLFLSERRPLLIWQRTSERTSSLNELWTDVSMSANRPQLGQAERKWPQM